MFFLFCLKNGLLHNMPLSLLKSKQMQVEYKTWCVSNLKCFRTDSIMQNSFKYLKQNFLTKNI